MTQLYEFQSRLYDGVCERWRAGDKNVAMVLPTGGGKTVTFCHAVADLGVPSRTIAHRQELVGQISLALAREGVEHRLIAPDLVIQALVGLHVQELGRSYVRTQCDHAVAGVDTLIRRDDVNASRVGLWVMDECHHLLLANKWGKAVAKYEHARGLGATATFCRADGKGLGTPERGGQGVFHSFVPGPCGRDLIEAGFLTPFKIYAPQTAGLSLVGVDLDASGDYNKRQLNVAVHRSKIVGSVVENYLKYAAGKLGVTFAVDVEHGEEIAQAYRDAGVPAMLVTANTPDGLRREILRRFRRREFLQLVNVDLFGEGFDLPAIEVISFARPTQSFSLFCQQFGRVLRIMDGKILAIVIDHVGNVVFHSQTRGLPTSPQHWELCDREKTPRSQGGNDAMPLRPCPGCTGVYLRFLKACPLCGHVPEPIGRSRPEEVEGDLLELNVTALEAMQREKERIDGAPSFPYGAAPEVVGSIKKQHARRQVAQAELRDIIALWAGYHQAAGRTDSESYRRFYYQFGIDVASAQTLGATDAAKLRVQILEAFT